MTHMRFVSHALTCASRFHEDDAEAEAFTNLATAPVEQPPTLIATTRTVYPMRNTVSLSSFRSSKRGHEQLVTYWNRIKGLSLYPTESQVDPTELKDHWNNMFLLEVDQQDRASFRYQYIGPSIVDAYGMDPTGKVHDSTSAPSIRSMLELEAKVAINGKVGMDESWFLNSKSQKVLYRCSLVPLCSPTDRANVHFILGFMSWRLESRMQAVSTLASARL